MAKSYGTQATTRFHARYKHVPPTQSLRGDVWIIGWGTFTDLSVDIQLSLRRPALCQDTASNGTPGDTLGQPFSPKRSSSWHQMAPPSSSTAAGRTSATRAKETRWAPVTRLPLAPRSQNGSQRTLGALLRAVLARFLHGPHLLKEENVSDSPRLGLQLVVDHRGLPLVILAGMHAQPKGATHTVHMPFLDTSAFRAASNPPIQGMCHAWEGPRSPRTPRSPTVGSFKDLQTS